MVKYRKSITKQKKYIDAYVNGIVVPPYEIEIQVSSHCNLDCNWCVGKKINGGRLPDIMNKENINKILRNIFSYEVDGLRTERIKFSGFIGEPLIHSEVILEALKWPNATYGLFTNGVLMTEELWKPLMGLEYVHVSLDGGDQSYADLKNCHKNTLGKVMGNICGMLNARMSTGSDIKINVGYVVVERNLDEMYKTAEMVKWFGVDSFRIKSDITSNKNFIEEIERVKKLSDKKFKVIHTETGGWDKPYCHFHNLFATVGSDGNMYVCDHNTTPDMKPLGNIISTPLKDIWTNKGNFVCNASVCPPFGSYCNNEIEKSLSI